MLTIAPGDVASNAARPQVLQECQRLNAQWAGATEALAVAEDSARSTADRLRLAEDTVARLTATVTELQTHVARIEGLEVALATARDELVRTTAAQAAHEEESAAREAQLRALNKTLKEEVRRLGKPATALAPAPLAEVAEVTSGPAGGGRAVPAATTASGEVNLEYLKYCILKYMEFDDERTVWMRGCVAARPPTAAGQRAPERTLTQRKQHVGAARGHRRP